MEVDLAIVGEELLWLLLPRMRLSRALLGNASGRIDRGRGGQGVRWSGIEVGRVEGLRLVVRVLWAYGLGTIANLLVEVAMVVALG